MNAKTLQSDRSRARGQRADNFTRLGKVSGATTNNVGVRLDLFISASIISYPLSRSAAGDSLPFSIYVSMSNTPHGANSVSQNE